MITEPRVNAKTLNGGEDAGIRNETDVRHRLNALDKSSAMSTPDHGYSKEHAVVKQLTSIRRRSTVEQTTKNTTLWNRRTNRMPSLNSTADDSVFFSEQHDEILVTARGLCRDYICYRLKRSGFRGRVVITKYAPAKDQNLSFDILKIGKTFEELYPHLFRNLARQLGYVLRTEHELRVLFDRLGAEVMGPDPEEYRWGRILALLGIAGSLSVDCIGQGHVELIENMVTIFCDFTEVYLVQWIIDHGGWENMSKVFSLKEERSQPSLRYIFHSCNFATATVTGIMILGIIFTMGAVSRSFSLYESLL